jgi:tetratricopeptide (TPR) repeat protein
MGHTLEAEGAFREMLEVRARLLADHPGMQTYSVDLGWAHQELAACLQHAGKTAEAIETLQRGLQYYRTTGAKLTADPDTEDYHRLGIGYRILGLLFQALGREREAAEACSKGIRYAEQMAARSPKVASFQCVLAWHLTECPVLRLRDPQRAVAHAKKGIELDPQQPLWWINLGAAYYRCGQWQAALEALQHYTVLCRRPDPFHDLFLAMTYWRLGQKQKARRCYLDALERKEGLVKTEVDLDRVRREAAQLLDMEESP